jgi:tetraacyldisaccharide 4'-kinase
VNPLSTIFGLGVSARNALYDRGILMTHRLRGPVISVGNLSAGGSGKTPFVILLGELLNSRGINFDVLSRGYGRTSRGATIVDPNGTAQQFGDEPLLIARRLGVSVIVGESRFQAGTLAEARFGTQLHLLDDGFQHRSLARDFDIVLLSREETRDQLLPIGRLREPPSSLQRADAVVLTDEIYPDPTWPQHLAVWRITRGLHLPPISARTVAFCGIARPERFLQQLRTAGMETVAHKFFRDHHAYTRADVNYLLELRDHSGASGFITTEKDAINLQPFKSELEPLAVARVTMDLENADDIVNTMLLTVEKRRQQP